jgi:hypothetical protein
LYRGHAFIQFGKGGDNNFFCYEFFFGNVNFRTPEVIEGSVVTFPVKDLDQMKKTHFSALNLELG